MVETCLPSSFSVISLECLKRDGRTRPILRRQVFSLQVHNQIKVGAAFYFHDNQRNLSYFLGTSFHSHPSKVKPENATLGVAW